MTTYYVLFSGSGLPHSGCFLSFHTFLSVSSLISLLSFCLVDLSIMESGVLKPLNISVWCLMCDLIFSNVSFKYVDILVFGA